MAFTMPPLNLSGGDSTATQTLDSGPVSGGNIYFDSPNEFAPQSDWSRVALYVSVAVFAAMILVRRVK